MEGQLARWMEELAQYDMDVLHRRGKCHMNADGLSRIPDRLAECDCYRAGAKVEDLPCGGCAYSQRCQSQWARFEEDVDDVVPIAVRQVGSELLDPNSEDGLKPECTVFESYTSAELSDLQGGDPELKSIVHWLGTGGPTEAELFRAGAGEKYLWSCHSQLQLVGGVLYYSWEKKGAKRLKLVVPHSLQGKILSMMHDTYIGGHFGRDKTMEWVKHSFFWYGLSKDVKIFVETCGICRVNKKLSRTPRSALGDYQAGVRLERVHVDLLGPFVESARGNRYILMIVDQFSKWVTCLPLPNQKAETVAHAFFDGFIYILAARY